jgi:LPXTG-site transpeptidase (sortase) family protein
MTNASRKGIVASINRSGAFLVSFVLLFVLTVGFFGALDMLPEGSSKITAKPSVATNTGKPVTQTTPVQNQPVAEATPELPVRVASPAIGMNVKVANPTSTNVETLDHELLSGAVRYPTSAKLGVNGTVLIFGHSSYLPIVHNQNYKAFDGIQNLKKGETISVYSGTTEYRYSVASVRIADATEDVVELPTTGKHLVLVTCDSFSKKTNRFVVTADLVGTYSLGK